MSFIFNIFNKNKNKKIYLCGIESSGKTSLLYKLISILNNNNNNNDDDIQITPTINGFNLETITINNNNNKQLYDIFDIGGSKYNRILYRHYLDESVDAIIFLHDQFDIDKFDDSINELKYFINLQPIKNKRFLILNSKCDLLNNNQNQQQYNNNINKNSANKPITQPLLIELNNNIQQINLTILSISIFDSTSLNNLIEWISLI